MKPGHGHTVAAKSLRPEAELANQGQRPGWPGNVPDVVDVILLWRLPVVTERVTLNVVKYF